MVETFSKVKCEANEAAYASETTDLAEITISGRKRDGYTQQ